MGMADQNDVNIAKPGIRTARYHNDRHAGVLVVRPHSRDEFQAHLRSRGITAGVHYPRIIPEQPALADAGLGDYLTRLENARQFASCEVSLPVHPFMTDADVEAVIQACDDWSSS